MLFSQAQYEFCFWAHRFYPNSEEIYLHNVLWHLDLARPTALFARQSPTGVRFFRPQLPPATLTLSLTHSLLFGSLPLATMPSVAPDPDPRTD